MTILYSDWLFNGCVSVMQFTCKDFQENICIFSHLFKHLKNHHDTHKSLSTNVSVLLKLSHTYANCLCISIKTQITRCHNVVLWLFFQWVCVCYILYLQRIPKRLINVAGVNLFTRNGLVMIKIVNPVL